MRVAAFDCGTNSLRLLVADVDETGAMIELRRETRIVRLGQGVDATGEFAPEALERTFAVTREYAEIASEYAPERIRFVATSASRDVKNRDEFFAGIFAILASSPTSSPETRRPTCPSSAPPPGAAPRRDRSSSWTSAGDRPNSSSAPARSTPP